MSRFVNALHVRLKEYAGAVQRVVEHGEKEYDVAAEEQAEQAVLKLAEERETELTELLTAVRPYVQALDSLEMPVELVETSHALLRRLDTELARRR